MVWISREKTEGPIWGHLMPCFPWAGKSKKMQTIIKKIPIFLGGPMGPIHPVWALAAIHPRWGNRYYPVPKCRAHK